MYHVIGPDGRTYGPAEEIEIRHWLREGRIVGTNKIAVVGTDEWLAISQTDPFTNLFAHEHSGAMYNVIAADGKTIGPLEEIEVRHWLRRGQLHRASRIQLVGSTAWVPIDETEPFLRLFGSNERTCEPPPLPPHAKRVPRVTCEPPEKKAFELRLALAILVTLCCFPLTGIPAVVYASFAVARSAAGDSEGAEDASQNARAWCWISVAAWLVVVLFLTFRR